MSEYKPGDLVNITRVSNLISEYFPSRIGLEVKELIHHNSIGTLYSIWTKDKSSFWTFGDYYLERTKKEDIE